MGSIFHPRTRIPCFPDSQSPLSRGRNTQGAEVRLFSNTNYTQPQGQGHWLCDTLPANVLGSSTNCLSMPEVGNLCSDQICPKKCILNNIWPVWCFLIAWQHFKIRKFHVKIQLLNISRKDRRSNGPEPVSSSVAKQLPFAPSGAALLGLPQSPPLPIVQHMALALSDSCLGSADTFSIAGLDLCSWWWPQLYKVLGQCLEHNKYPVS